MGAEFKNILSVSYVNDTEVGYYTMGELAGCFDIEELKDYIKRFGSNELFDRLAFLQFQVYKTLQEINTENNYSQPQCNNTI